jgi:hypothetical protein
LRFPGLGFPLAVLVSGVLAIFKPACDGVTCAITAAALNPESIRPISSPTAPAARGADLRGDERGRPARGVRRPAAQPGPRHHRRVVGVEIAASSAVSPRSRTG